MKRHFLSEGLEPKARFLNIAYRPLLAGCRGFVCFVYYCISCAKMGALSTVGPQKRLDTREKSQYV